MTPAMACLLFWGQRGVDQIRQVCLETPRIKVISPAISLLLGISMNVELSKLTLFIYDEDLLAKLEKSVVSSNLAEYCEDCLSEIILNLEDEDIIFALGTLMHRVGMMEPSIFQVFMNGLSARWLGFGARAISEYEGLLREERDNEPAFHSFFENHPTFLDPLAIEVWSKPDFHGFLEPDFVVRRGDDSYLVIEIEKPSKMLITQSGQISAAATQAEKQVLDYKRFITQRLQEMNNHFPNIDEPDCLVVIGMESSLSASQKESLRLVNLSNVKLKIVGFDHLMQRAKTLIKNVTRHKSDVHVRHRVY
ncbi:Shedu anti-phage system protein SduA domain-containing protein [Thalassospira sp. CH_XMU1458]|uniref:Shedu anti-phage system protein SduA domain-containing protein n=1 Tax=Thalassospira sp. CH_XMU1458 TaxID=3107776 RepID=UPI00300C7545